MGFLPKRTILSKLHSGDEFHALDEVQEFERKLATELEKGSIERIPVGKLYSHATPEEWYRDKDSGVVYRYIPPEFPLTGLWAQVKNPEERSYFDQISRESDPTKEQYEQLAAELEKRWRQGEVERAPCKGAKIPGALVYHHTPSDETFELFPPFSMAGKGIWRKVFRSHQNGSWPGNLEIDIPPTRPDSGRERK